MTMKTKLLICLAALLGVAAIDKVQETKMPRTRFTVQVLSEDKQPMPGATVTVYFTDPATRQERPEQGSTNDEGLYLAEGYFGGGPLGGSVTKAEFYESGWPGPTINGLKDGRWQPWDETYTTHLRPVINPVPMYAKVVQTKLPATDKACGYDLSVGDWVAPHGKGRQSDFIFKGRYRYVSRHDFECNVEMSFAQPLDGLAATTLPEIGQNSFFKWPRAALESGYKAPIALHCVGDRESVRHSFAANDAFFFRVRTVERNGEIVAANYGRLTGLSVDVSDANTCDIMFTYYLNPTSLDRNMESDPKRNLFPGLRRMETPQLP